MVPTKQDLNMSGSQLVTRKLSRTIQLALVALFLGLALFSITSRPKKMPANLRGLNLRGLNREFSTINSSSPEFAKMQEKWTGRRVVGLVRVTNLSYDGKLPNATIQTVNLDNSNGKVEFSVLGSIPDGAKIGDLWSVDATVQQITLLGPILKDCQVYIETRN